MGKPGLGQPKGSISAKPAKARAAASKPNGSSPAVDWDAILAEIPKSFTREDLAKATPALKAHAQARNRARTVEPRRRDQKERGW
jgi:hypothetical protein